MPLDALTQQRIRALEIVVAWLIEQSFDNPDDDFALSSQNPNYILELAENIMGELEDD